MAKFKQLNLPGNAQAAFDDVARPKMDASLAQAKAKMTEAETKRDADRTKAVTDAQAKVTQAHADADKQQQAKVAESRTKISNHQADTRDAAGPAPRLSWRPPIAVIAEISDGRDRGRGRGRGPCRPPRLPGVRGGESP